ncbi:MAG: hypothetical protein V5A38_03415 [Halolamina sp.]|uniref:hypothetical protein n=1 Tax=Halolamina sp. TaxID=1940283 RepID=UPI002FC3D2F3
MAPDTVHRKENGRQVTYRVADAVDATRTTTGTHVFLVTPDGPFVRLMGVEVQPGDAHRLVLHVRSVDEGGLPDDTEVGTRAVVVLPRFAVELADVLAVLDTDSPAG